MSSINEIRNRIAVINAEVAKINTQRNQNIGRREALKKQLDDAFELYQKNYGVVLTAENLEDEIKSVMSRNQEELSKIERILGLIQSGNIAEANKVAGVENKEVVQNAVSPVSSVTETPVSSVAPPVVQPVTPPVYDAPVTPPSGATFLEGFSKPALGSMPQLQKEEPPAKPKSQINDFGAILNGTAFKPN